MNGREFPQSSARAGGEIADVTARRAIDAPADAPLLAITGRAASGKTETLARRYVALLGRDPSLTIGATIVTAPRGKAAAILAARIGAQLPPGRAREYERDGRYVGCGLDRLAFDILADHATLTNLAYDLEAIDPYDAEEIFERAIAPLFSADWNEFLGPDIDPEIPGLRAPDRFAAAVLRLIRKLRAAQIGPDAFYAAALRGATAFYANPPNLSAPALLFATKDEHRGALAVGASELERQRRRELDLAKIITKVYRSYLDELVLHGCLTPADAVAEATRLLDEHPALARTYRRNFRIALVDDAQDLPTGEFRLLTAIFGTALAGVTVAGDPQAATETFAGARPERVFGAAAVTLALQANYRVPAQIAAVVDVLLDPQHAPAVPSGDAVQLHRAATPLDEAAFVADSIAGQIAAGTPPGRLAVVHRSLRSLAAYEDALVARDIPIALQGDAALFVRHDALDALALLWSTVDPFAHAWILRVLQLPLLALNDASLAILCGEPASAQALLFDLPPDETDGSRRWDRRRDLRLGTNVVRGDRDADLAPEVRDRLIAFRTRRASWQRLAQTAGVAQAAAAIVNDGGMHERRPNETGARARRRSAVVGALLATIARYAARNRDTGLAAALAYCERIARGESGPILSDDAADAVVVGSIDAVKARRFERVYVVDVRAGSFPPYYVPDAFLFSPTYGMIPKDSVGDALTARTAKFTWYAHQAKLRENYSREDRRALAVALGRADVAVTVSASGRPTRGVAAPELLVELQALRPQLLRAEPPPATPAAAAAPGEPAAGPPAPALPAPSSEAPAAAAVVALERVAEMLACVRCAPRRTIPAVVEASFTLLSGRLPARDERVEERDVAFAFALGPAIVYGTISALVRHGGQLYVAFAQHNPVAAGLAARAFAGHVAADAFFIETPGGVFTGPHPVAGGELLDRASEVLSGARAPLCRLHDQHH
ncbi:MAG: UvrD-helicase domain-containing protein [Candidatus Velthaea sp.]